MIGLMHSVSSDWVKDLRNPDGDAILSPPLSIVVKDHRDTGAEVVTDYTVTYSHGGRERVIECSMHVTKEAINDGGHKYVKDLMISKAKEEASQDLRYNAHVEYVARSICENLGLDPEEMVYIDPALARTPYEKEYEAPFCVDFAFEVQRWMNWRREAAIAIAVHAAMEDL